MTSKYNARSSRTIETLRITLNCRSKWTAGGVAKRRENKANGEVGSEGSPDYSAPGLSIHLHIDDLYINRTRKTFSPPPLSLSLLSFFAVFPINKLNNGKSGSRLTSRFAAKG